MQSSSPTPNGGSGSRNGAIFKSMLFRPIEVLLQRIQQFPVLSFETDQSHAGLPAMFSHHEREQQHGSLRCEDAVSAWQQGGTKILFM